MIDYVILVILIIIIFIISVQIIKINYVKEKYQSSQCNYLPWGPKLESCVNNCKIDNAPWDTDGTSCNEDVCMDICIRCTDERCEWNNIWLENKPVLPEIKKETDKYLPSKLVVRSIKKNETEILLSWNKLQNIYSYMIHYYKNDNYKKIWVQNILVHFVFGIGLFIGYSIMK